MDNSAYSSANWPLEPNQCGRRNKNCTPVKTAPGCGHRFTKAEHDLVDCPVCGRSRLCRRWKVTGYDVCRMHGAGSVKKGRYGGDQRAVNILKLNLPERMLPIYEAALADDLILSLRQDAALLESRKHDLVERSTTGESRQAWDKIQEGLNQLNDQWDTLRLNTQRFNRAQQAKDSQGMKDALNAIFDSIITGPPKDLNHHAFAGKQDFAIWDNLAKTVLDKAKLISEEWKHMEANHRMISVERVMAQYQLILSKIEATIEDKNMYKLILAQFIEVLEHQQRPMGADSEAARSVSPYRLSPPE